MHAKASTSTSRRWPDGSALRALCSRRWSKPCAVMCSRRPGCTPTIRRSRCSLRATARRRTGRLWDLCSRRPRPSAAPACLYAIKKRSARQSARDPARRPASTGQAGDDRASSVVDQTLQTLSTKKRDGPRRSAMRSPAGPRSPAISKTERWRSITTPPNARCTSSRSDARTISSPDRTQE